MDVHRQDDQFKPTYSSSVLIRAVALRTCQKQWTIGRGGERGSGISVLIARHDDDDDGCIPYSRVLILCEIQSVSSRYLNSYDTSTSDIYIYIDTHGYHH